MHQIVFTHEFVRKLRDFTGEGPASSSRATAGAERPTAALPSPPRASGGPGLLEALTTALVPFLRRLGAH